MVPRKNANDSTKVKKKRQVLSERNEDSENDDNDADFECDNSKLKVKKSTKKKVTKSSPKSRKVKIIDPENIPPSSTSGSPLISPITYVPRNLVDVLHQRSSGVKSAGWSQLHRAAVTPLVDQFQRYKVARLNTPFDSRTTAISWHTTQWNLAAAGSKWGDIVLWDTQFEKFRAVVKGRGPGGSIQTLKFDTVEPGRVFTASIDGYVARHDFVRGEEGKKVYLSTNDWEKWYTGLDVSFTGKMVVAGNNSGFVTLLSLEGEQIWQHRLHKAKCNFVQFSDRQPWLVVTSSIGSGGKGGSVKIWDIRNIGGPNSSLAELVHDKAVNSAMFSQLTGDKLLTTDQHSQIRVYQGPCWNLLRTISHPHRQFQHLTPIKATWHPLADLAVVGRYPDPNFPGYEEGEKRSIDLLCPESGKLLHRLHQPGLDKIISLSSFNPGGDRLLSGMGSSLVVWQPKYNVESEETDSNHKDCSLGGDGGLWPEFGKKKAREKKVKAKSKTVA